MSELAISAMKALDNKDVKIVVHSKFFGHTEMAVCKFRFLHKEGQVGFLFNGHHLSLDEEDIVYYNRNAEGHFFYDKFTEFTIFAI